MIAHWACGVLIGLAGSPIPQKIQIGLYGEVQNDGLMSVTVPATPPPGWDPYWNLIKNNRRPNASNFVLVAHADGQVERLQIQGDRLIVNSESEVNLERLKPQHGDVIYIPTASEAVVVGSKTAHYIAFDVPSIRVADVAGPLKLVEEGKPAPKALIYPRFFERFRSPDLAEKPNDLRFQLIGFPATIGGTERYEPFGWIERPSGEIRSGDLVLLEGSSLYEAALKSKAEWPNAWDRKWMPAPWSRQEGYDEQPATPLSPMLGTGAQKKPNAQFLAFGVFDRAGDGGSGSRSYLMRFNTVNGRPNLATLVRPIQGRLQYIVERTDRTVIFVNRMQTSGSLQSLLLNNKANRDSFYAENQTTPDAEKKQRALAGARVFYRMYPMAFADFYVELDTLSEDKLPTATNKERRTERAYVLYEQEGAPEEDPFRRATKLKGQVRWVVIPNVMKRNELKPIPNDPFSLRYTSAPLLSPADARKKKPDGGALVFRLAVTP